MGKGHTVGLASTSFPDRERCICPRLRASRSLIYIQPFSQKSRTPTVVKEFQIGLCGVVEADLELFCNCWSAGFLGERLYVLTLACGYGKPN